MGTGRGKRNKLKQILQRRGVLRTIILNLMVCKIIIFLLLAYALIVLFNYNSAAGALDRACQISDILLDSIWGDCREIYNEIGKSRYHNDYASIMDVMAAVQNKDRLISSVYLYDEQPNIIMTDRKEMFTKEDFFDQDMINLLEGSTGEWDIFWRDYNGEPGNGGEYIISCYFQDDSMPEGERIVLCINIDQEKYENWVWGDMLEDVPAVTELFYMDRILKKDRYDKTEERIADAGENSGMFRDKDEEGKYFVFWKKSDYFDGFYIWKVRYDIGTLSVNYFSINIFAIVGIFIIMEVLSSWILVKKIYIPLQRVADRASLMIKDEDGKRNEYELIDIAFNRLETYNSRMRETEYYYVQNRKREILQKLLYGDGDQIHEDELREVGIVWDNKVFCVITVSINHLESLKEIYSHSDMNLFCFAIINIMEEYLGDAGYTVYGVDNEDNSISIIMQIEGEYEKSDAYIKGTFPLENITDIQKLLYGAKQKLERTLNFFTVFISVGRSVKKYEDIHRSWLDTKYAAIYRFTRGDQLVTLFTTHMESYESGIQYPWDIEKKLLSNMKSAKKEVILLNLEDFFTAVQKMAPNEMRWAISQIMTSIFRSCMSNCFNMKDGSPLDWKYWVSALNTTDTKYEMKDVLVRLIMNLSMENEENDSAKKKLADSVKLYIDSHFCEDTLSVSGIASQVGYSVNYVRQIFKEMYGISISDYILEKRIERAQELLLTTSYTSKKIAQMVGYSDNRHFYVVFKKRTGETAENFRQQKK